LAPPTPSDKRACTSTRTASRSSSVTIPPEGSIILA
jgi:hypothetical protein